MKFILASNSPRRKELLTQAGFVFDIHPADIDETALPKEAPLVFARRMAIEKAQAVSTHYQTQECLILAADTIVVLNQDILGKPRDESDAKRMLQALSGQTHTVMTGYALLQTASKIMDSAVEETKVTFRNLSQEEIYQYIQTGEPMDKAGSYGIQALAGTFVTAISGSQTNVIGLPIEKITKTLKALLVNPSK